MLKKSLQPRTIPS